MAYEPYIRQAAIARGIDPDIAVRVSGILSKIMWLVITGLIMAFVTILVSGGLKENLTAQNRR